MSTLHLRCRDLPLRPPLRTLRGTIISRRLIDLRLDTPHGPVLAEAAPLPAFGGEDAATCLAALHACQEEAATLAAGSLASCEALVADCPVARYALDMLLAEQQADPTSSPGPRCCQLLAGADDAAICSAARALPDRAVCKLKAWPEPARSAALVQALHAAGPQRRLRVDVNGAWSETQAQDFLGRCKSLIDCLEQPCAATDLAAHARLQAAGHPIALDESLRSLADISAAITARAGSVAVLKPALLGGTDRTLAAARALQAAGWRILISTLLEGARGRRHCARIAAACDPKASEAHGLATGHLLGQSDPIRAGRWQWEAPSASDDPLPSSPTSP